MRVAVSGGFDPVHIGHIRLFEAAKSLGDELVVILNNDNWLMKKKGFVFMPQDERVAVISALRAVDMVLVTGHAADTDDMSVCRELEQLKPGIFANGGDRYEHNIPEYELCEKLGITMRFHIGGEKMQSSSELARRAAAKL